jgi:predicted regulator of Ras-like GTPase activity (Roadblock/LC7/MglB family)
MIEEMLARIAGRSDVVRVVVSDQEGLLIASLNGKAVAGDPADSEVGDDLWSASTAQFAGETTTHLKDLTLARPLEMAIHGTKDTLLFAWLNVGWLVARVTIEADLPSIWVGVRRFQNEFNTLTGEKL